MTFDHCVRLKKAICLLVDGYVKPLYWFSLLIFASASPTPKVSLYFLECHCIFAVIFIADCTCLYESENA